MYKSLRGMYDILPYKAGGSLELCQFLETVSSKTFRDFGYCEIRTPILEEKALFVKSIGSGTDIVTKEMFSFCDRGERDIALRPEGTAPIVRAYLEANLHKINPFQKFYYIGPMFRAERPQAGRQRQFYQIGIEAIGSSKPAIDAEAILLLSTILDKCKIKDYTIKLNNLGCHGDKIRFSRKLKEMLSDKNAALCDDCKKRLDVNPLRIVDCKKENCRIHVRSAMKAIDFLCDDCKDHFKKVNSYLKDVSLEKKCVI
ncbi:MAG: histidine--tRNA ligase, partial [Candidatus Omnitrophica bacterium]|nr:histidine--tRNA ligase [Candidatus Omnitrophota bacterium]